MIPKVAESIICDGCGSEMIKNTSYPAIYAIEVRPIDVNRNTTGSTFLTFQTKPETAHFCNKKCLAEWANT